MAGKQAPGHAEMRQQQQMVQYLLFANLKFCHTVSSWVIFCIASSSHDVGRLIHELAYVATNVFVLAPEHAAN